MAEPTNETGLVKAMKRAIVEQYPSAVVYKIHGGPMQESGIPDLLVIVDGRIVAIEAKFQRPGESTAHALSRVSPVQVSQLRRLEAAGATVGVALSVEGALKLVYRAVRDD